MMQQLQDVLTMVLNRAVMGAAGMTVRLEQVRSALGSGRLVGIKLLVNVLLLPGLAWGGATVLGVAPPVALDILLAAAAPGGGTGPGAGAAVVLFRRCPSTGVRTSRTARAD